MKYSYNWLQELSGTRKKPQELAEFLTVRAFEVESVEEVGFDIENVVVGEVTSLEKHPNADRLRVAQVFFGKETLQIVCGAPNIEAGQKVPVAKVGAKLPGNVTITKSEIRGITSNGMICSQKEIGLGEGQEGIMVLPHSAKPGTELKTFLKDTDYLLDIKVLPDRAHDALSHVGMAREIAALEDGELDFDYDGLVLTQREGQDFTVTIENAEAAKRYIGFFVKQIKVKDSPLWLKNRLKKIGVKSVNNVVDTLNFVMYELGQPMHAYDWDKISSNAKGVKSIHVRHAKKDERIKGLDNTEYILNSHDIIIADTNAPLALAGIIGGADSQVTSETKNIFIESANFDAVTIRKTRTRLGIRTDASDRFEKSIDSQLAEKAMVRVMEVLEHMIKGEYAQCTDLILAPAHSKTITFHTRAAQALLGVSVSTKDIAYILPRLGFEVMIHNDSILEVKVPSFRLDVTTHQDIIEEIGRLLGYEAILPLAPRVDLAGMKMTDEQLLIRKLQDNAASNGFHESLSYSFYSKQDAEFVGMGTVEHLELANPMNPNQVVMRASVLPTMLHALKINSKTAKTIRLFEIGNIYYTSEYQSVHENAIFAGILMQPEADDVFFTMKGLLDRMFTGMTLQLSFDSIENVGQCWHPTRTADIFGALAGSLVHIGRVGEIHPFVLENYSLKKRVAYFEFNIASLIPFMGKAPSFTAIRKFPLVLRDISLKVPRKVRVKDILDTVTTKCKEHLVNIELFDQYTDVQTQEKSLAFHVHFGAPDRTLEGGEVDALLQNILTTLEKEYSITQKTE